MLRVPYKTQQPFLVIGIRFRIPPHPHVMPRTPLLLNRVQRLIEWKPHRHLEFPHRHAMTPSAAYLVTVAAGQLRLAGDEPTCGWPTYSVLPLDGNPAEVVRDPVGNAENFWSAAADSGWAPGAAMDPLTSAPKAAKAAMVYLGEFRALDENARLTVSSLGT